MARRKLYTLGVATLVTILGTALLGTGNGVLAGQHGGHHHGGGGGAGWGGRGGGFGPFYGGFGVGFPFMYPPVFLVGPGMFLQPDAGDDAERAAHAIAAAGDDSAADGCERRGATG